MGRREALSLGAVGIAGLGVLGSAGTAAASSSPTARLAGPTRVPVGAEVTFNAGHSTVEGGEIADYRWFAPDTGELGESSATVTHEFTETGDMGIQVTIEDDDGNTDLTALRVQVIEDGVVPGLDGPDAVEAGESVHVGIDWDQVDTDAVDEFEWTVTRESDGETIAETSGSDELGIDFTPEEQYAYYTVEGVFVDDNGTETIGTHLLQTAPHPTAELEGPSTVPIYEPVTFDASGSMAGDSSTEIVDYRWFVPGTGELNGSDATITHEFTETGDTGIQVTVEDERGHTDSESIRVEVTGTDLSFELEGTGAVEAGESTSVGIDFARTDVDSIAEYEWTVTRESDGKTIAETSGPDELDIRFTPEELQTTYTVEGTAISEDGAEVTETRVVETARHPVAELDAPDELGVGELVTLDASGSSHPGDSEIVDYRWYTTDSGNIDADTDTLTHEFTETGYVGVQVTVEDENGFTDSEATRVYVTD